MKPSTQFALDEIAIHLKKSKRLLVVTGAGISAEAGLPTYRGVGGVYAGGETEEGLPIEAVVSGAMLLSRPEVTWKYLTQIEKACRGAKPSRAHSIIAELETRFEVVVLTQNVDGLHRAAGSSTVIDIHGDFRDLRCMACQAYQRVDTYEGLEIPPRCNCKGFIRPEVVLFGEFLPVAKLQKLAEETMKGFDMVFSIGTTSLFPYIAGPVLLAAQQEKPTVEINPEKTEISDDVMYRLPCKAGEALEGIVKAL